MTDEEQKLQQQFLQLLSITENMQQRIITLEKSNQLLLNYQKQFIEWMDNTLAEEEHYRENIIFELQDSRVQNETEDFWYPHIASVD